MILTQSNKGRNDNACRSSPRQYINDTYFRQQLRAKDEADDTQYGENTGLTTATACSNADTGVGAIIAAGSQPCSGITAAFTEPAKIISTKIACSTHLGAMSVVRKPPGVKSIVPLMQ